MAFIDQYALALDSTFQKRVMVAMLTAATQIQSEATSVANHVNRANYAKLVLNAPPSFLPAFCCAVTTNAVITAASLDSDIQFEVNSVWNALAGVV